MGNFDLRAKNYDTDNKVKRAKAIADEIRLYIQNGDKKSAIEYGCGTGLVGFQLLDDFSKLLFIDSSIGMIEQVKQKLVNIGKSVDSAILCDFMTDALPQNIKIDYIFTSLVLHHIKELETILSNFYDLLNNGGHLLIVDFDIDDGSIHADSPDFDGHNGFEQSFLIDLVKKVGFAKAEATTFYHDTGVVNDNEVSYSLFILNAEK